MSKFWGAALVVLASTSMAAEQGGGKVEVTGAHVCCNQCVRIVGNILGKVDGVSDVLADSATRTVTFTAKDEAAAQRGVKALIDGGFYGKATAGGKELKVALPAQTPSKEKTSVVVVKDVHVCCGQCQKAINKVFADSKVSFEGKGPQRTVRIEGKDLVPATVLQSLLKAGFYGKVEK